MSIELKLSLDNTDLAADDPRWRDQVRQLRDELKREAGSVRTVVTPEAGKKGGAEAIILALGSAGAISAAVTIFKAWLERSANRSLDLEGEVDGRAVKVKLTGKNINEATLLRALGVASGKQP